MTEIPFIVTDVTKILSKKGGLLEFRRAVTAVAHTYNYKMTDEDYYEVYLAYYPDYDKEILWELAHNTHNGMHPSLEENYNKLKFQKDIKNNFNLEDIFNGFYVIKFEYFEDYRRFINSHLTWEQEYSLRDKLRRNWVEKRNNVEPGPMADAMYEWADKVNDIVSDHLEGYVFEEIYEYAMPMYRILKDGLDKNKEA